MKCVSYSISVVCLMTLDRSNETNKKKEKKENSSREKSFITFSLLCECFHTNLWKPIQRHTYMSHRIFFFSRIETAIVAFYTRSFDTFSSRVTPSYTSRVTRPTVGEHS